MYALRASAAMMATAVEGPRVNTSIGTEKWCNESVTAKRGEERDKRQTVVSGVEGDRSKITEEAHWMDRQRPIAQ